MAKLRISARPDGKGWIDYRHNGKRIGSSKQSLRLPDRPLIKTNGLNEFIEKHNLQSSFLSPTKGLCW